LPTSSVNCYTASTIIQQITRKYMEHRSPEQVPTNEVEHDWTRAKRAFEISEGAGDIIEGAVQEHPEAKELLYGLSDKVAAQVFREICDMLKISEAIRRETVTFGPGEQSS
jgi:hypothetical protein